MPRYAHLSTTVLCPHCGDEITDMVWFQWSFCRASVVVSELVHNMGQEIRWGKNREGEIPSWAYFEDRDSRLQGANIGDPSIRNIEI